MSAQKQKALLLPVKQGQFEVGETTIPTPGPKDVLVKITATALNPVDWKIQAYGIFISNYPCVLGTDAAGIVEDVGSEVSNVAKGDKMCATAFGLISYCTHSRNFSVSSKVISRTRKLRSSSTPLFPQRLRPRCAIQSLYSMCTLYLTVVLNLDPRQYFLRSSRIRPAHSRDHLHWDLEPSPAGQVC